MSTSDLRTMIADLPRLAIGPDGAPLAVVSPKVTSQAALLVRPLRDALKIVGIGGLVEGHADRDQTWQVVGFVLAREVVEALDDQELTAMRLYDAVRRGRFAWEVVELEES